MTHHSQNIFRCVWDHTCVTVLHLCVTDSCRLSWLMCHRQLQIISDPQIQPFDSFINISIIFSECFTMEIGWD